MSVPVRARWTLALIVFAALAGASATAHAEVPNVGGEVSSMLALSLGEPSALARARAGRGGVVYTASVAVEVTATEAPSRLTVADGEAFAGRRRGHLVRGASVLREPLQAAAGLGAYKSLDAAVDPLLQEWNEPVSNAATTIRLRQVVLGRVAPRDYRKPLLLTLTSAEP